MMPEVKIGDRVEVSQFVFEHGRYDEAWLPGEVVQANDHMIGVRLLYGMTFDGQHSLKMFPMSEMKRMWRPAP